MRFLKFHHFLGSKVNIKNFFILFFQKKLKITSYCVDFMDMRSSDSFHFDK